MLSKETFEKTQEILLDLAKKSGEEGLIKEIESKSYEGFKEFIKKVGVDLGETTESNETSERYEVVQNVVVDILNSLISDLEEDTENIEDEKLILETKDEIDEEDYVPTEVIVDEDGYTVVALFFPYRDKSQFSVKFKRNENKITIHADEVVPEYAGEVVHSGFPLDETSIEMETNLPINDIAVKYENSLLKISIEPIIEDDEMSIEVQ